jgi:predicted secreted protein
MAVYNTNGFTLSVGGTAVAGIIDATVTLTLETIEVTEVGAVDRKHVGGIRSASASGNIFYDQGNAQILALEAAVISGATVAVVFTLHSGATYTGTAYVTSFNPTIAVNDVVKASFNLQFTGAVTVG